MAQYLNYTITNHTYNRFKKRFPHIAKDKKRIRKYLLRALKDKPTYSITSNRVPINRKIYANISGHTVTIVLYRNNIVTVY